MALLEVVLLAGPAFAVGARKQQRSLALMSAAGGTPIQSRRVVIGTRDRARRRGRGDRRRARHRGGAAPRAARAEQVVLLPRSVRGAVAAPRRRRRVRSAQRLPGLGRPGVPRLAPGRRRRARRPPRRRGAVPQVADPRDRPAGRRHLRLGHRRDRRRRGDHRRERDPGRPRHDPVDPPGARRRSARSVAGCRWCCGTPSATRPGTAPGPCPRSPPSRRPSPASSPSASA